MATVVFVGVELKAPAFLARRFAVVSLEPCLMSLKPRALFGRLAVWVARVELALTCDASAA